jgi:hypothetical protein
MSLFLLQSIQEHFAVLLMNFISAAAILVSSFASIVQFFLLMKESEKIEYYRLLFECVSGYFVA